nr:hypothetical protein Itr_chr15CG12530 [Ipomoea trifida]GLL49644.1 hypothetical protein Itr_chr15CG12540 [Ipomoea trifida]
MAAIGAELSSGFPSQAVWAADFDDEDLNGGLILKQPAMVASGVTIRARVTNGNRMPLLSPPSTTCGRQQQRWRVKAAPASPSGGRRPAPASSIRQHVEQQ